MAEKKAAEEATKAKEEATKAKEVKAEKAEASKSGYFVAEGKSITSKKGILGPGEQVKESFLAGGKESIDLLIKKKTLVKK